eukprot:355309-Alexandrium_andersonii.AAC.1
MVGSTTLWVLVLAGGDEVARALKTGEVLSWQARVVAGFLRRRRCREVARPRSGHPASARRAVVAAKGGAGESRAAYY